MPAHPLASQGVRAAAQARVPLAFVSLHPCPVPRPIPARAVQRRQAGPWPQHRARLVCSHHTTCSAAASRIPRTCKRVTPQAPHALSAPALPEHSRRDSPPSREQSPAAGPVKLPSRPKPFNPPPKPAGLGCPPPAISWFALPSTPVSLHAAALRVPVALRTGALLVGLASRDLPKRGAGVPGALCCAGGGGVTEAVQPLHPDHPNTRPRAPERAGAAALGALAGIAGGKALASH